MRRHSPQHTGAAIVALAWLIGGGLLAAPREIGECVRGALRDGLWPGQRCLANVSRQLEQHWPALTSDETSAQFAALEQERDRWRQEFLALQAVQAQRGDRADDSEVDPPLSHITPSEPLIVPDLVPAQVLGVERNGLRRRVGRMLNRGTSDGIAVDDLVLDDPFPLIDRGHDAEFQPDMPVLAGDCVIGRIQRCARWTSTVQPITDADFRSFVQIVRLSPRGPLAGAEGVLAGNGDGTCRLEMVAATEPVSVGDHVYGRLLESGPTATLYYGRIAAAELPEGAPHWTIRVDPAASLDQRHSVEVLRELPNPLRFAGR